MKLWKLNGHKKFRSDLALMYFAGVECSTGKLLNLKMIPMQIKKFRLNYTSRQDAEWLEKRMNKVCKKFNSRLELKHSSSPHNSDNSLLLCR